MTKKITYEQNQFEVYITNKEIKKRIKEIANDLNTDFISDRPIFIGVLNGCIYFMMDLLKEIKFDYEIDFDKIKSYVGMEQHDISSDLLDYTFLKDKNIIIVEDIIDSEWTKEEIVDLAQDTVTLINNEIDAIEDTFANAITVNFVIQASLEKSRQALQDDPCILPKKCSSCKHVCTVSATCGALVAHVSKRNVVFASLASPRTLQRAQIRP